MHAIIEKNGGIQPHFDVDPTKSSTTAVVTTAPTTESTTKDEKDHSRDKFIQKSKYAAAMMEMMDTDDFDKYEEKEPTQYQSTIKDTTGIIDQENLTVSDNLICCYSDPLDPKNRIGRPFIMTDYIKTHWNKYMNHQALDNSKKKEVTPQLVTAASSNHFVEFREHAKAMRKHFPGEKMVVYDLGLSDVEIKWIKEGPDHDLFIYKKFDFSQLES